MASSSVVKLAQTASASRIVAGSSFSERGSGCGNLKCPGSVTLKPLPITKLFLEQSSCLRGHVSRCRAVVVTAIKDPAEQDSLKRAVARKAVELVQPGMVVGLGTGSTSSMAIEELGKLAQNKLKDVQFVATSYQSRVLSRQFGVKTMDLNDVNHIDIAFDGADEVDSNMNLIKGGGAAHTMEKVVDSIAKHCVILVDETKVVKTLGLTFPVPVEVLPFALAPVLRALAALGGQPEIRTALRKDGPVMSDLGNMIVDVRFPDGVKNPAELERKINMIPGVVENGLFVNVAHTVLVGTKDGEETSVVTFADFVQTLRNSELEVSS
ncbi:uncharacterized protein [Physcomitrium patens]|uniref:ribose-5-phosphate isomerase n=1 Tax=Physcomitrium patens TaxID=3218 RepID=A0A2K1L6F9_PHYPA|nr:uncharacterized protein LOC112284693 [Physcomitrium patens]PNR61602.1 hypothetical protein PHYPA_000025 [Physcomitrium patens]|eukprot:XP_024380516.1 uncharacterized protein LOC112284693 [Physcomitrella patens]